MRAFHVGHPAWVGILWSLVLAAPAGAQVIDSPTSRLQVIHASPDPRLAKLNVFVHDGYPAQALNPPLGSVTYGKSSGYLVVPSGKHKVIVCKVGGGACSDGLYELDLNEFGTVVVIGTRGRGGTDDESTVQLVPVPGVAGVDLETQRRWKTATRRRISVLNGIVDSPPIEVCHAPKGKAPSALFAEKKEPFKGEPIFSFGQWAGIGQVTDEDTGITYGTHVDIPRGILPLELRAQGDDTCAGLTWGETGLEKPEEGMLLLVVVGEQERAAVPREVLACSEPKPPSKSECFRHRVRLSEKNP